DISAVETDFFCLFLEPDALSCSQSLRTGHCSATDMKTDSRRQSIGRNGRQKTIGTLRYTSSQVFETLLMQPMPPHLSVECLVVYLRLLGRQGDSALMLYQKIS